MIVIAAVLEISEVITLFQMSSQVLVFTIYYVAELAGFMSEHQFVAFMHILKRTGQNWNNRVDAVCENDDVINSLFNRNFMNGRKSVLFTVSNNAVTSNREKIESKSIHIKQLIELHASACDIAESVNAIYSPTLLLSVAKFFTAITHILYYVVVRFIVQKATFLCKFGGNNSYFIWLILFTLRLIWLICFTAFTAKEVSHNVSYFNFLHNFRYKNIKLVPVLRECVHWFV
jgi:hypothetical protein